MLADVRGRGRFFRGRKYRHEGCPVFRPLRFQSVCVCAFQRPALDLASWLHHRPTSRLCRNGGPLIVSVSPELGAVTMFEWRWIRNRVRRCVGGDMTADLVVGCVERCHVWWWLFLLGVVCVCVCVCVLIDVLLLMLEKERVMKAGVEAMSTAYGTQYPYGPGSEVLCEYFHNTTAISDGHPLTKPTRPHCVRFDVGNNQRLRVRSAGHRARIHARTAQLRSGLRAAGQRHHPRGHRSLERSQGHGKRINSVIMIFHFLAWRGGLSKN